MSTWGGVYFQNGTSPIMEELIFFHDHTMLIMIVVMAIVGYMLYNSCFSNLYNLNMFEGQELESIWTVLPIVFLVFIAFPSLRLLYMMEDINLYEITVSVLGHQWYWSYEYADLGLKMFDAYMLEDEFSLFRLLNVDNCLLLPYKLSVRMIVSSMDVIHSWTLPSVGVKVDAIPGRLNQLFIMFSRMGIFSGQCSEICGANHSFMPIMVGIVSCIDFLKNW